MTPQIEFEDFYVGVGLGEQDVYLLPNSWIVIICSYSANSLQNLWKQIIPSKFSFMT